MKKQAGRISALLAAALMLAALLAGCGQSAQPQPSATGSLTEQPTAAPIPTPTPKPAVPITGMFPGQEPAGLADVFQELNTRLYADISVKLALSWAPEDTYDAALDAALASGTPVDFFWCSPEKVKDYAGKSQIAPLDDLIAQYGQALTANIPAPLFDTMKLDGKLMAVPSAGNVPLSDTGHAFTVRDDLRQKYSLPALGAVADIESYFKAVKDGEPGVTPLVCNNAAFVLMKAFGPEELLDGTGGAVAWKAGADGAVTCVPLQGAASFKGAVAKVRAWYKAGYLPWNMVDVKDSQAQLTKGTAAAVGGSALAALSAQADAASAVSGAQLADVPVFGKAKYIASAGSSALCLTAASKSAMQAVQCWNWVLASPENYDLFCYGLEGKNYKLDGERISFLDDSYQSFPAWIFRNMNYERFPSGTSDSYIDTLRHWNDNATLSPLMGFVFDPTPVKDAVAKVQKVFNAYSPALNAGSADTAPLLAEFGTRMKAAGQDAIVAEAQKQIKAFLAAK